MEDALVQVRAENEREINRSLNPCFNGRCTRTITAYSRKARTIVS